jgi:hypothetical protein
MLNNFTKKVSTENFTSFLANSVKLTYMAVVIFANSLNAKALKQIKMSVESIRD